MKHQMGVLEIVQNSRLYGMVAQIRRWFQHSAIVGLVTNTRVQEGIIALILLVSLVSVFRSNTNAAIKFLSFALLFVVTVVVTWSLTDPITE